MKTISTEFKSQADKIPKKEINRIPKFQFDMENYVGKAITNRLDKIDISAFEIMAEWNKTQTTKFVKDILGPINYADIELNKLIKYLTQSARRILWVTKEITN